VREGVLQTPRSVKRRGRRYSRHWSRDSATALREDHGDTGCSSEAPGGPHTGAGIYVLKNASAHRKAAQEQDPVRIYISWKEAHAEAGFLSEPVTLSGIHTETVHS